MSRRVSLALLGFMAAASGAYLLIYLVRWEWHRAIIAGLFFIAAEVALVAGLVLSKMRSIDRKLDQLTGSAAPPPEVVARLRETAPPPRTPFAWLKNDGGDFNVFLPVLLGAGLLASAAAWVVESVARATARPVLERDLASRLAPVTWPSAGLLGHEPDPVYDRGRPVRRWVPAFALVALAGGGLWGYDVLADAIQTRPEEAEEGISTEVELRFSGRRTGGDPARMAADLWGSCKLSLHRELPPPTITGLDDRRATLVIDADLGRHAATRIRGCLEDATIDHLQTRVVSVTRHTGD
jgi:hypothetical protein